MDSPEVWSMPLKQIRNYKNKKGFQGKIRGPNKSILIKLNSSIPKKLENAYDIHGIRILFIH